MAIRIHTYAAPADKFFVNSFLVETDTGVIIIDTQFLVSSAQALKEAFLAIGKPLAAIIITHPHPDHFNGLPVLLAGRDAVPVYANAATIAGIRATQAEKRAAWTPVYGADYPAADGMPDHEISSDATLMLAGAEFRVIDLGPGESADNTVIHIPQANALIASDLIYNKCHPWLAEHRSDAWLVQLDRVEAEFSGVETIYPGHGPAGGPALFGEQRAYIHAFKTEVAAHARDGKLAPEAIAMIEARLRAGRDGWALEALIPMNAAALADELGAQADQ
jgi:glyoxylase-like metal-dependent hydrolase (beta-lactamase superfamily II)